MESIKDKREKKKGKERRRKEGNEKKEGKRWTDESATRPVHVDISLLAAAKCFMLRVAVQTFVVSLSNDAVEIALEPASLHIARSLDQRVFIALEVENYVHSSEYPGHL